MTFSVKLPFLCAPSEAPEALVSALVRKYPEVFKAPRQASPMKDYDLLRWLWEITHQQGFDGTAHSIRYDGPDEWVDISFTKGPTKNRPELPHA